MNVWIKILVPRLQLARIAALQSKKGLDNDGQADSGVSDKHNKQLAIVAGLKNFTAAASLSTKPAANGKHSRV